MRPACHLCHEAVRLLQQSGTWPIEAIDIDDDPELGARYGLRIPVLRLTNGAELDWPFNADKVLEFTLPV